MNSTYKCKVSDLIEVSPLVKTIRLDLGGKPFSFQAGQYIILGVDLSKSDRFKVLYDKESFQERPFSISSNPLQTDSMEITVVNTDNGFMTDYFLNYLTQGTQVDVDGPLGEFFFQESRGTKYVMLLGAGSGIMPLISMASYIADKGLETKVHMLFSFQNQEKIILRDKIRKLSEKPNISSNITLTRDVWEGSTGRIDQKMIKDSGFPLEETDFYICGPSSFKKDVEEILTREYNVSRDQIFK